MNTRQTTYTVHEITGPEIREDGTIVAHFVPGMIAFSQLLKQGEVGPARAWVDTADHRVVDRIARKRGLDWLVVIPARGNEAGVSILCEFPSKAK